MTVDDPPKTVVNRCAVVVTPRQPMVDWTRPFWTPQEQQMLVTESSLYLIPTYDNEAEAIARLQSCHTAIFAAELSLWCRDQELWPRARGFEMFLEWFSLQFHHLVEDLGLEPLAVHGLDPQFENQLRDALS
ncbi:MAG: hypothetical protein NTV57_16420 [Cyanobacteria bacterium]|nr:hypothetical protein [Cyanobacteriota bacterium]